MRFIKPMEVWREMRRSFNHDSGIAGRYEHRAPASLKRSPRANTAWVSHHLNHEFLDLCKEPVCRVNHPNPMMQRKGTEIRVSIMPWSRGSYLDIRQYMHGHGTGRGILLHLDIIKVLLPEIIMAVRRMEMEDTRDPKEITTVEVING